MKNPFAAILIFTLLCAGCHAQSSGHFEPIAVIELFTSEGCNDCPPADKLLTKMAADAEKNKKKIFALSFHVDSWNRLDWSDPFSSSSFSERQRQYDSVMDLTSAYTPQVIVNGTEQMAGSDEAKLSAVLAKALKTSSTASFTRLTVTISGDQKVHVSYALSGETKGCEAHFALISLHESNLVKNGKKKDKQFSHSQVVRQFITVAAMDHGEMDFDGTPAPGSDNMEVIAFVQRTAGSSIIAAAEARP